LICIAAPAWLQHPDFEDTVVNARCSSVPSSGSRGARAGIHATHLYFPVSPRQTLQYIREYPVIRCLGIQGVAGLGGVYKHFFYAKKETKFSYIDQRQGYIKQFTVRKYNGLATPDQ
jgi:hypothetical protein